MMKTTEEAEMQTKDSKQGETSSVQKFQEHSPNKMINARFWHELGDE